jgi:Uncharacterized protein conserved in bacteria (DUF2188)
MNRSPFARAAERFHRLAKEVWMPKVTYHIVEHDGGWAYRVGDVFSETYPSHDGALAAAKRAAAEQQIGGESTDISYEDSRGRWHVETAKGGDRPDTDVEEG